MNLSDKALARKLALAVALKLLILFALWWLFFHNPGSAVDSDQIASRLLPHQSHPQEGNKP